MTNVAHKRLAHKPRMKKRGSKKKIPAHVKPSHHKQALDEEEDRRQRLRGRLPSQNMPQYW